MLRIEGINRSEFLLYFSLVKSIKGTSVLMLSGVDCLVTHMYTDVFFRVRVQQKK